jgi:hypothetical protein
MQLGVDGKSFVLFTPKYGGNDQLPEAKRVRMEIHAPTVATMMPFAHFFHPDGTARSNTLEDRLALIDQRVRACVRKIDNLYLDGQPISNGAELMDRCPSTDMPLLMEVVREIDRLSKIDKALEKNCASQSDGSPAGKAGAVETACATRCR